LGLTVSFCSSETLSGFSFNLSGQFITLNPAASIGTANNKGIEDWPGAYKSTILF
jgi:hypothetical protein